MHGSPIIALTHDKIEFQTTFTLAITTKVFTKFLQFILVRTVSIWQGSYENEKYKYYHTSVCILSSQMKALVILNKGAIEQSSFSAKIVPFIRC